MKQLGSTIFIIGFTGFIIGVCGYDSNPVVGFITGIIGLAITWTGYQMGQRESGWMHMDTGTEMKFRELEKMLNLREQLIETQNALGKEGIFSNDDMSWSSMLVYSITEFMEIAEHVGSKIERNSKMYDGMINFFFRYRGIKFNTYAYPKDADAIMNRIHENV